MAADLTAHSSPSTSIHLIYHKSIIDFGESGQLSSICEKHKKVLQRDIRQRAEGGDMDGALPYRRLLMNG